MYSRLLVEAAASLQLHYAVLPSLLSYSTGLDQEYSRVTKLAELYLTKQKNAQD